MAHEIESTDRQEGREMGWHNKTIIRADLSLALPNYLSSWQQVQIRVCAVEKMLNGTTAKVLSMKDATGNKLDLSALVVFPSEGDFLTEPLFVSKVFTPTYRPLCNAEFLEVLTKACEKAGIPLDVSSLGSVRNRTVTFVSIPLPGMATSQIDGQEFKYFLNAINSTNGEFAAMFNISVVKTVCMNTAKMNLRTGGCFIKHTPGMTAKLDTLPAIVAEAHKMQAQFANDYMVLAGEALDTGSAQAILSAFVADKEKLSTRSFNQAERMVELFRTGKGNRGETFADAYNAITDYYTHESAGKTEDSMKQFESSEFGSGDTRKRQGLAFLRDLTGDKGNRLATIDRGNKLRADYFAAKASGNLVAATN